MATPKPTMLLRVKRATYLPIKYMIGQNGMSGKTFTRNDKLIASMVDVVKTYGDINVVDGVSFDLFAGTTTILVGPNGSGKTTTLEMLVGLRSMNKGSATIAGIPVVPGGEHRFYTGVQLQSSGLPARIKTKEVIQAVECLYSHPVNWKPMARDLGVDAYLDAIVDNLSGGQRRRLDILCAAIGRPSLLVLDEPTSGIDPEGRAIVWDFVRSLSSDGCAIIASTHDMAEAEAFGDSLLVMAKGKIQLEGSVDNVLSSLGGNRRLRVSQPNKHITRLVEDSGLRHGHSGAAIVAIGSNQNIADLVTQINQLNDTVDILTGTVRLEDVFAVVSCTNETPKDEKK